MTSKTFERNSFDLQPWNTLVYGLLCKNEGSNVSRYFSRDAIFIGLYLIYFRYKWNLSYKISHKHSTIQISFSDLKKEIGNHSVISIFHFQFENEN